MKILVTGAAGFVGSNLANRLYELDADIVAVDNLDFGYRENLHEEIDFLEEDFASLHDGYLNQFDILVHCACANIIYAQENQVDTFRTNALKTIKLFDAFKGKIVYTSTASVYGQASILPTNEEYPVETTNAYDQSKYIAELFLSKRQNYTTLRLSNVYGKNQRPSNAYSGVIGKFIYAALNNKAMRTYGNGRATRDYTYIDDVVEAIIKAINTKSLNTEINISTGRETSVQDLILYISNLCNISINVKSAGKRDIDRITRRCLDASKAKKLLDWEAKTDIIIGLQRTIKWQKT